MNYHTTEPDTALCAFVKCYWTLDAPKENNPKKQRIVPDGCMEMIFHYGDLYKQFVSGESYIIQPTCFVFGQISHPLYIEPTGVTGIFEVRFHPDGFTPFTDVPVTGMENRAVTLQELFGDDGVKLEKEILAAVTNAGRIKIVETFLLKRLVDPLVIDRITKSSVAIILSLKGQLSVDKLLNGQNISRRQLERKFSSVISLSPKQLSKIIRLQATLKMLEKNSLQALHHLLMTVVILTRHILLKTLKSLPD